MRIAVCWNNYKIASEERAAVRIVDTRVGRQLGRRFVVECRHGRVERAFRLSEIPRGDADGVRPLLLLHRQQVGCRWGHRSCRSGRMSETRTLPKETAQRRKLVSDAPPNI